jgi:hypothetical protein
LEDQLAGRRAGFDAPVGRRGLIQPQWFDVDAQVSVFDRRDRTAQSPSHRPGRNGGSLAEMPTSSAPEALPITTSRPIGASHRQRDPAAHLAARVTGGGL